MFFATTAAAGLTAHAYHWRDGVDTTTVVDPTYDTWPTWTFSRDGSMIIWMNLVGSTLEAFDLDRGVRLPAVPFSLAWDSDRPGATFALSREGSWLLVRLIRADMSSLARVVELGGGRVHEFPVRANPFGSYGGPLEYNRFVGDARITYPRGDAFAVFDLETGRHVPVSFPAGTWYVRDATAEGDTFLLQPRIRGAIWEDGWLYEAWREGWDVPAPIEVHVDGTLVGSVLRATSADGRWAILVGGLPDDRDASDVYAWPLP